jgi:glyoxylate reductase
MSKPKVFVTRVIPEKGLKLIRDFCEVDLWQDELPPPHEILQEHVRGVDGILSLLTDRIDGELLDLAGEQLKVISNYAVGFDNIVIPEASARGIPVGNTPGILTDATADCAFALLMSAGRRIVEAANFVRNDLWKTWSPSGLLGVDYVGATLGLVGFGRIGRAVAKRAAGFDMNVIYYDPSVSSDPGLKAKSVDLDTLLSQSDFISLHTPLNHETYHLINAAALKKMKPNVVLVNTSRGGVIEQMALYDALKSGRIFAAGLDVTDPEPLPITHPLFTLENCIIVPHIASASKHTRDVMALLSANNLIAGLKGERLPHCVNPEVYDRS